MSNFKFVQKLDDDIQSAVNSQVDDATMEVRDQIDAIVTDLAYTKTANIIEELNLEGLPADPEEIHDELFMEISDSIYNELGIY